MVKMSKAIPEQPMGEACPLHRGANLPRRQARSGEEAEARW